MKNDLERLLRATFPDVVVPASAWSALLRRCAPHKLSRGATLFVQGDPAPALYGVVAGEIELRFGTVDGKVSVIEHVGESGLFGLASFATGLPSRYDAVASRPTRLIAFGSAGYAFLMDEVPGFARALLCELARRHDGAMRLLEASRHRSAIERLTLALAQLVDGGRATRRDGRGFVLVRASQSELASLSNLSRQTINELLQRLAVQRRARPAYGGVWIASDWLRDTS